MTGEMTAAQIFLNVNGQRRQASDVRTAHLER